MRSDGADRTTGVLCACGSATHRVTETRATRFADGVQATRRRRQCGACGARFSTYEIAARSIAGDLGAPGDALMLVAIPTRLLAALLELSLLAPIVGGVEALREHRSGTLIRALARANVNHPIEDEHDDPEAEGGAARGRAPRADEAEPEGAEGAAR